MEALIYNIASKRRNHYIVYAAIIVSLIASILLLPTQEVLARMLPGKSANTFTIYIDTKTNASIKETQRVSSCVAKVLQNENEITDMEIYLGQGAPLDYAGLVKGSGFKQLQNQAEIVVNLTNKNSRDEASYMMVHRLRPLVLEACANLVENTSIRFIEMPSGPPTLATIVVEVYGENVEMLRSLATRVANILENTDGLVDIDMMRDDIHDFYELIPTTEKVVRSGLSVQQVNEIVFLAFKGMPIAVKNTSLQQDQIPIFIRLGDETRVMQMDSEDALREKLSSLKLMNRYGLMVPISEVIEIKKRQSRPLISRKNLKNLIMVTAECDMVSQVYPLLDAREVMLEELKNHFIVEKDPGINTFMFDLHLKDKATGEKMLIRWDGEMKVTLDTFRDLGGAFIAALVLMFLLMVVYYKSFILSGIVLIASFLSIIGVIAGHWITDIISLTFTGTHFFLTATSLIGFISLMGISARASLLLIDFTKSLIASGIEKNRAIAIATSTRAKPIMLTAVAIILGSLLLATDPIFGGLGVALIFGSIASTLVSLFYVPVLMTRTRAILPSDWEFDEETKAPSKLSVWFSNKKQTLLSKIDIKQKKEWLRDKKAQYFATFNKRWLCSKLEKVEVFYIKVYNFFKAWVSKKLSK